MPLKIHLIPDTDSELLVDKIIIFLRPFFPSPVNELNIEFVKTDVGPLKRVYKSRTWEEIWGICNDYRQENQIRIQDNYTLFITTDGNTVNYFASQAMDDRTIGFVHCSDWQEGFGVSDFNGTTFHLVVLLMRMIFYGNYEEAKETYHRDPIACINDFTGIRDQVILKFKSAHICPQCVTSINNFGNLTPLTNGFFHGAMVALQKIRLDIIKQEVNLTPLNWHLNLDEKFRLWIQIDGLNSKIQLKLPKGRGLSCYLSILKNQSKKDVDKKSQSEIFKKYFIKIYAMCSLGNDLNASEEYLLKKKLNGGRLNWTEAFSKNISDLNTSIQTQFINYPQIVNELYINTENEVRRINLHSNRISADFWERFQMD